MPKKSNPGENLNTKEKILQEAVVQFAAHGYEGTSLEKIARACHPPMTAQHCAYPCLRDLLMPFGYRVMTILDRLRPDLSNADYSKIMKAIFGLVLYPKLSKGMAPFIGGKAVYDKALVDVTMQMVLLVIYAPRLPVSVNLEHMIPSMAPMFPFPVRPSEPRPQFQGAEPDLVET